MNDPKDRLLFIAPAFMSYEKVIIEALSTKYNVTYLDSEQVLQPVRKKYKSFPFVFRALLKFEHHFRTQIREKMLKKYMLHINGFQKNIEQIQDTDFSLILIINGDGLPSSTLVDLRNSHPNTRMVLYLWDDYNLLFKTNHISIFDEVYSFNLLDCKRFGFILQSMFTPPNQLMYKDNYEKKYDICMIGSATPERVNFIKKLKSRYNNTYSFYIYLYYKDDNAFDIETHNKPLNFEEYMQVLSESRCLFEIVRSHQKGPTTRVNDCKFVKTKIITTNNNKECYAGNGNNICFLDDEMIIPEEFVKSPYDTNVNCGVTIDSWISSLLEG